MTIYDLNKLQDIVNSIYFLSNAENDSNNTTNV